MDRTHIVKNTELDNYILVMMDNFCHLEDVLRKNTSSHTNLLQYDMIRFFKSVLTKNTCWFTSTVYMSILIKCIKGSDMGLLVVFLQIFELKFC